MNDPALLARSVLSQHLRPSERLTPSQWAEKYRVVLDPSPRPGRWKHADAPWTREPMDDWADPSVAAIVLCWAPQSAKTEVEINCLCYTIDAEPFPILWVTDSTDNAREFAEQRLLPALRAMPRTARHISARRWDTKLQGVMFDTCSLNLVGSNSAGRLASKPVGRLIIDERDKFPSSLGGRRSKADGDTREAGAVQLAYARLGSFGEDARAIEASSPTIEDDGIHARYMQGDQAVYHVPCPGCERYQPLVFRRVRWNGGDGAGLSDLALSEHAARAQREAWYECPHCQRKIHSHEKRAMLLAGAWVRAGQEIIRDKTGPLLGGQRVAGTRPDTRVRSYQLSRLYPDWFGFGDVAQAFIECRGVATQDFVNKWLAEPWKTPGARGDESSMLRRAAQRADAIELMLRTTPAPDDPPERVERIERDRAEAQAEKYDKGTVPGAAMVLMGAADVQRDGVYYLVAGLGAFESVYVLDWGFVDCPELVPEESRDNWALVAECMRRRYPRASGQGQALRVHTWSIDSGYRTREVYTYAAQMGRWVVPTKGVSSMLQPLQWSAVNPDGAPPRGQTTRDPAHPGAELLLLNADYWKDELYARLHRTPPQVGAWRYPGDIAADASLGHDLFRQLTAEERRPERRNRRVRLAWGLRPGRADNHYLDCATQLLAMAEHLGMARLGADGYTPSPDNPHWSGTPAARPRSSAPRLGGVRAGAARRA